MKSLLLFVIGIASVLADSPPILKNFIEGSNKFTADVYKECAKLTQETFMICPVAVDILLALFHGGAKGQTAQQISEVLHLPRDQNEINQVFSQLTSDVLKGTEFYDVTSANKVYLRQGFQIQDDFKNTAERDFDAEVQSLNFGNADAAAGEMNRWVQQKTHDKIQNLVSSSDISQDLAAVLLNAMYFKGKWLTEFYDVGTKEQPFHSAKGESKVSTMEIADSFDRYESLELDAKFLEMPYKGENVSMTFVLPNKKDGLPRLEERMDEVLATPPYEFGRVHARIPKFKHESSIQYVPLLQSLGLEEPFSNRANFSGIGVSKDTLGISKIVQKTFVEIDEKGTEAAAGTGGFLVFLSASYVPPTVLEFIADHPFIFYIKIKGVIVFVGRYMGP